MTFDEIEAEIMQLQQRMNNLLKTGQINSATSTVIGSLLSEVSSILGPLELVDPAYQDIKMEAVSRGLVLSGAILHGIEGFDPPKWMSVLDLLSELLLKVLGGGRGLDIFVVESPFGTRSLEARIGIDRESVSLILLLSPVVNFLDKKLRALIAHEVAHADPMVRSFYESYYPKRRKTGQSLADALGFLLLGPAFPYSLTNYALNVRGIDQASIERSVSPSLGCRLLCLDHLNDELWNSDSVKAFSENVFQGFRGAGITISQNEHATVPYYLREGRTLVEERRDCMIDEVVLKDILNGRTEVLQGPNPESIELNTYVINQVQP